MDEELRNRLDAIMGEAVFASSIAQAAFLAALPTDRAIAVADAIMLTMEEHQSLIETGPGAMRCARQRMHMLMQLLEGNRAKRGPP